MFTGIIEEQGKIIAKTHFGGGVRLAVRADMIFDDLKIDDSVAINGVCQTVVKIENKTFYVEAVEETLKKTTLGTFQSGQIVNLERALTPSSRMGGHIVQGHVDCVGNISRINHLSSSVQFFIHFSGDYSKFVIPHGSITIDGTSLTVAEKISSDEIMLSIIPHTLSKTLFSQYTENTPINIEFDVIGKYVENMLLSKNSKTESSFLNQFIDQPF